MLWMRGVEPPGGRENRCSASAKRSSWVSARAMLSVLARINGVACLMQVIAGGKWLRFAAGGSTVAASSILQLHAVDAPHNGAGGPAGQGATHGAAGLVMTKDSRDLDGRPYGVAKQRKAVRLLARMRQAAAAGPRTQPGFQQGVFPFGERLRSHRQRWAGCRGAVPLPSSIDLRLLLAQVRAKRTVQQRVAFRARQCLPRRSAGRANGRSTRSTGPRSASDRPGFTAAAVQQAATLVDAGL